MNKLEQKLIELGYERFVLSVYTKDIFKNSLFIRFKENKILKTHIVVNESVLTQQDIDNLQQAFNVLLQDLEVLKDEN